VRLIRRVRDERRAAVFWVEHVMEAVMGWPTAAEL
jgi:ABC-type branched-subunit amino acid transport system ATPase component